MLAEEHVIDLIPAYALGSLEEDEARQVKTHLETCATCRAELTQFTSSTSLVWLLLTVLSER
jgi:anti-sigma factor RsiW